MSDTQKDTMDVLLDAFVSGKLSRDELVAKLDELIVVDSSISEFAERAVKERFMSGQISAQDSYFLRERLGGFEEDGSDAVKDRENDGGASDLTAPLPGSADVDALRADTEQIFAADETNVLDSDSSHGANLDSPAEPDMTSPLLSANPPVAKTEQIEDGERTNVIDPEPLPDQTAALPESGYSIAKTERIDDAERTNVIAPERSGAAAPDRTASLSAAESAPVAEQSPEATIARSAPSDTPPDLDTIVRNPAPDKMDSDATLSPTSNEATRQPQQPASDDGPTNVRPDDYFPTVQDLPDNTATRPPDFQLPDGPGPQETEPLQLRAEEAPQATLPISQVPKGTPSSGTGSNWGHPEQWSGGPDGPLVPGDTIGRYHIEKVLGQGGMGIVFKARDRIREEARDSNPYVAMKVLSEEFKKHPQSFIALAREWKKAAALSHENIITVYDFDRIGSTVFMTMELLEGQPLDAIFREHALRGLPEERALKIVEGCSRALAFAHSKGIVHADFKPGNVFVLPNDDVKVLDFGIARAVPTGLQQSAEKTVFDASQLGAMTPTYASAEMLNGLAPTAADDVYALALVAYEAYAGRHPYDRTPAHTALKDGVKAPPLVGPGRRQRQVIRSGIAFERERRPENAQAFLRKWLGLQLPKWVYGAIAASLLAAAFFGYQSLQEPGPDRPFSQLSAAEQQQFTTLMDEGREDLLLATENGMTILFGDALNRFSRAYAIHPRNPDAVAGLKNVSDRWLESLGDEVGPERRAALESGIDKFVCQDYLNEYPPIRKSCEEIFDASQCSLEGGLCPSSR